MRRFIAAFLVFLKSAAQFDSNKQRAYAAGGDRSEATARDGDADFAAEAQALERVTRRATCRRLPFAAKSVLEHQHRDKRRLSRTVDPHLEL